MAGRNRHKCAGSSRLFCHDEQARPFLPAPPTQPRRLESPAAALPSSLSARACSSLLLLVLAVGAGGPPFPPPAPAGLVRFGGFAAWLPAGPPKGPLLRPLVAFRPVWFTEFVCAFPAFPLPWPPPLAPLPRPSPLHPRGGPLAVLAQKGGAPRGGGRLVGARPTVPARALLWAPRSQPGPARKGRMMRGPPLRGDIPPSSGGIHPPALRAAPPSGWALAASRM